MHIPTHPRDFEKHLYINHRQSFLTIFSVLSFTGVFISSYRFFQTAPLLYIFYPILAFTTVYYLISLFIQGFGKKFDAHKHQDIVEQWNPKKYPTVDIFLPVCGEDIKIIHNTWQGIKNLQNKYKGLTTVYALDDGDSAQVKKLAQEFEFKYLVRENRGKFKKAGNLKHGFDNSNGEFIVIFDADFRPRTDFLDELLPYFELDKKLGIVQTPQYFDVHNGQNWIERGAGAVQEYFYRALQQIRQAHEGAICVGSNAIYRRAALAANGGTTLIEHSEDVHTGFDLKSKGWELLYLPIILAKGICPNDLMSFFRQQYRWCMGSMSLMGSSKFWDAKIKLRSRLSFITGFMYYIHTALMTIVAPLIPLALLYVVPEEAKIENYLLLLPSIIYTLIIFPIWHKTDYKYETTSIKIVYGWAHLFALVDVVRRHGMDWVSTGSASNKNLHFDVFKTLITLWGSIISILWIGGSIYYMINWDLLDFLPVMISGVIYALSMFRIITTAYTNSVEKTITKHKNAYYLRTF